MKRLRFALPVLLLGASALITSCGETSPLSPKPLAVTPRAVAKPEADLLSPVTGLLQAVGLLKCSPLPEYDVTQVIGPAGGVMVIGPHTFTVPAGALTSNVTISAVAAHDNVNRIAFQPQGLTFNRPASLTMSYANCNLLGILLPKHIAYVDNDLHILYYLLGIDNLLARKVTGQVNHFSEYAAAW